MSNTKCFVGTDSKQGTMQSRRPLLALFVVDRRIHFRSQWIQLLHHSTNAQQDPFGYVAFCLNLDLDLAAPSNHLFERISQHLQSRMPLSMPASLLMSCNNRGSGNNYDDEDTIQHSATTTTAEAKPQN